MKRYTPVRKRREKARRRRPELVKSMPKVEQESWRIISKRVRLKWWKLQPVSCGICWQRIWWFEDMVPDHIEPGKMGGCKNHDESNLQPAHWWCNLAKGSRRSA